MLSEVCMHCFDKIAEMDRNQNKQGSAQNEPLGIMFEYCHKRYRNQKLKENKRYFGQNKMLI